MARLCAARSPASAARDDLYEVTCGVLRHHLGTEIMLSLYEEDAGRVWLRAQRGYAETIHSYPLGDGLIAQALREDRAIAILAAAASDPRCIALGVTAEATVVAPFTTSRVRGALVLESLQPLEPADRGGRDRRHARGRAGDRSDGCRATSSARQEPAGSAARSCGSRARATAMRSSS